MGDFPSQAPRRQPHIILVDGNRHTREDMKGYLSREGYRVTAVGGGSEARALVSAKPADLVIVCLPLPDMSAMDFMRALRGVCETATIILSNKDDVADRVAGLEVGADDYLPRSLHRRELLARIRSMLRRMQFHGETPAGRFRGVTNATTVYRFAGWRLDRLARSLTSDGGEADLSPNEFDLLITFLENPRQILSRQQLLDLLHHGDAAVFDRSIDVQIGRLRRKIERNPRHPLLIKTIRGAGYILDADVAAE
jgi:DNA-binding response OmpR family regulator